MPSVAADIPIDLYDLILSFYKLAEDKGKTWDDYRKRNYVAISGRQRGSLRLVCHDWARALQPTVFQKTIVLRYHKDVKALLGLIENPDCRIAEYVRHIQCRQFLPTYAVIPWIHALFIKAIPALPRDPLLKRLGILELPLPLNMLLLRMQLFELGELPNFAHIRNFSLTNFHFGSLGGFVRLLNNVPSLTSMNCSNVTWGGRPDRRLPAPNLFLHGGRDRCVRFEMTGCTDNTAAAWLCWNFAIAKSEQLHQGDSDALCRIPSAIVQVDATRYPEWKVESYYWKEERPSGIDGGVAVVPFYSNTCLTPSMSVRFASPVTRGEKQRLRSVKFTFWYRDVPTLTFGYRDVPTPPFLGWAWSAIDGQLVHMDSLQTVLLVFYDKHELLRFSREVVASEMPRLRDSPRLKYVLARTRKEMIKDWVMFTHDAIDDGLTNGQQIENYEHLL